MSVALRRERAWRYAAADPTGDEITATTWAVALGDTADGAYWVAYAAQAGREEVVGLRRTTIAKATFTVDDGVPVSDTDLWRLQRTGTLYSVAGTQPVPDRRVIVFTAESVQRGQYAITADVPAFTAANVILSPFALNISVGTSRYFRATVTNAENVVLPDRPVKWTSSDYNIARVEATGKVEGMSSGVATITATAGDAVGTALVTVF